MGFQVLPEGSEGLGFPSLGGEQDPRLVQIHEEAQVMVSPLEARLVDLDPADPGVAHLVPGLLHVVMDHPPDPCVVLPDHAGHRSHRHALHHRSTMASDSSVNPLPGRAQGTSTSFTPHASQWTLGIRAWR